MKYSTEKLKELYDLFVKDDENIFNKSKYLIYRELWKRERKDLNSKWFKRKDDKK